MKKVLSFLMAAALIMSFSACNSSSGNNGENAASEGNNGANSAETAVELSLANVTSDNGKEAGTKFGELVEQYSDGSITVKQYPDNQLGDDATTFKMCQQGDVDIAVGSTSSVSSIYPDYYVYDTPFLFMSKQEVYDVGFGGETGQTISNNVEKIGLKSLAMWENGFRNLTTNSKPIASVADLKGLKIRTMANNVHLAAWKAMGVSPTPMTFSELYTAMQQGTVDGQENPIGIILGNNFQEVEKNIIYTEHVYTPYYVVMNLDKWNSLSDAQQDAISKAMKEATAYQYEISQKIEDDADEVFKDAGCTVTHLTAEQKEEFKDAASSANCLELVKEQMEHPELADALVSELEAYRAK
ncbi:MAG: DctP family TRAP transporter solute-binding subunit [Oscillospiraceae bacterium]|jgi:TRAP-type transport system periplasmic protein